MSEIRKPVVNSGVLAIRRRLLLTLLEVVLASPHTRRGVRPGLRLRTVRQSLLYMLFKVAVSPLHEIKCPLQGLCGAKMTRFGKLSERISAVSIVTKDDDVTQTCLLDGATYFVG